MALQMVSTAAANGRIKAGPRSSRADAATMIVTAMNPNNSIPDMMRVSAPDAIGLRRNVLDQPMKPANPPTRR